MMIEPKTVVATPLTAVRADPACPSRPSALCPVVALRTRSTTWYLRSRKPRGPWPFVRSSTRLGSASISFEIWSTSGGMNTAPRRARIARATT